MKVWVLIYRDDYPFEAWSTEEQADARAREIGEKRLSEMGRDIFRPEVTHQQRVEYFAPAVIELDMDVRDERDGGF